jgi:hypothetical protein
VCTRLGKPSFILESFFATNAIIDDQEMKIIGGLRNDDAAADAHRVQ